MRILKFILKLLGGLVVLSVITGVVVINWDGITFQYNKIFWEPDSTSLEGVSIGDSKSDVIFNKGEPTKNFDQTGGSTFEYENEYNSEIAIFQFDEDDLIRSIGHRRGNLNLPFSSVDQMKEILGEEDILAVTTDYLERRYTYLDWGVSYNFINNEVYQVQIGLVEWRNWRDTGEYIVKGKIVCPSDDCPWDEEGELKPEYEEKDYRGYDAAGKS